LAVLLAISGVLAYIARRENIRAEENFKLAENAVDEMLLSAGRAQARVAEDVPELEEFRRELLEKAGGFYSIFTRLKPDSLSVREQMAQAHFRLGDINRILLRPDAAEEYEAAIAGFKALSTEDPHNSKYTQALANSYNWLGETLRLESGKEAEADAAYGNARQLQQELVRQNPQNDEYRQELARTHYNRGIVRYVAGRKNDSEADFRSSIDLLRPIAEKQPNSAAAQELGRAYNDLGTVLRSDDRQSEAKEFYEDAVRLHTHLLMQQPDNREYKQELATFDNNLALLLLDEQQFELAAQANRQSLELMEQIAAPALSLGIQLASAHNVRCEILLSKSAREAEPECERALQLLQNLRRARSFRASADFQKVITDIGNNYVDVAKSSSTPDLADQRTRALANLFRLLPEVPEPDRSDLTKAYRELKDSAVSIH
jgi:tetratricopeptide (TPR) repeat protein